MAVPYPTKVGDKNVRRVVKLTRTDNFTVAHRFEQRRYRPSTSQMKYLAALTECSRLAVWAYLNATRQGAKPARPVSCRAYESLPTPTPDEATCSPRLKMVGGLEMSVKDMLSTRSERCRASAARRAPAPRAPDALRMG